MNGSRVLIGAVAGAAVWTAWSLAVETSVLGPRYPEAQGASLLLETPRYPLFFLYWVAVLFLLSWILAWLYAHLRESMGPGPRTALKLGTAVGFACGFPIAFTQAAWSPLDRFFPAWWALELWVGAIAAALVAGWLYRPRS